MIGNAWAFVAGLLFSVGLALGGMTDARNVVGFLDVTGSWQPGLALVMVGAISVYASALAVARRRSRPLIAPTFSAPLGATSPPPPGAPGTLLAEGVRARWRLLAAPGVDTSLVVGSALFGLGWGWAGYCPGPALSSVGAGHGSALIFVGSMLAGTWIAQGLGTRPAPPRPLRSSQSVMAARS